MQLDPLELAKRYERMPDDEFRLIKRADLVPAAQEVYDSEALKRGSQSWQDANQHLLPPQVEAPHASDLARMHFHLRLLSRIFLGVGILLLIEGIMLGTVGIGNFQKDPGANIFLGVFLGIVPGLLNVLIYFGLTRNSSGGSDDFAGQISPNRLEYGG